MHAPVRQEGSQTATVFWSELTFVCSSVSQNSSMRCASVFPLLSLPFALSLSLSHFSTCSPRVALALLQQTKVVGK